MVVPGRWRIINRMLNVLPEQKNYMKLRQTFIALACHYRTVLLAVTSQTAQPVTIASTAEKMTGGGTKYFQLSMMLASCSPKKTQPRAPIACGLPRARLPRCQARKAANSR